jgi:hypothetical protein
MNADFSIEAILQREIAILGEWLCAEGMDLDAAHPHAAESSREQLYWRYGYFVGLKQALAMLTSGGATLQ